MNECDHDFFPEIFLENFNAVLKDCFFEGMFDLKVFS